MEFNRQSDAGSQPFSSGAAGILFAFTESYENIIWHLPTTQPKTNSKSSLFSASYRAHLHMFYCTTAAA